MNEATLRELLAKLVAGDASADTVVDTLKTLPVTDLGFARLDTHRELRQGLSEVVYAEGKTPEQVAQIMQTLAAAHPRVMATRASAEHFAAVTEILPEASYHEIGRIISHSREALDPAEPAVPVICAGTSDLPVVEEAALTLELNGRQALRIRDVGVSGLHRLLEVLPQLQHAPVVIAVAGMEGALPGVVAGLVAAPVIAVPTSIGYGTNLGGLAPLLTMLNSCSSGMAVVNIDNGFGAAQLALKMLGAVGPLI